MPAKDPQIDAYIAQSPAFARPILIRLRKLVHTNCPGVEEVLKWRFPHFMHHGILCSMAAFKQHCTFGFWKGQLVVGRRKSGGATAHGQFGRIQALSDLPPDEVLGNYIRRAARLNEDNVRKPAPTRRRVRGELVVPGFFEAALRKNPKALRSFEDFSYSHRKEYVRWLSEAKREETRNRRLETALHWLANGKSRYWKYQGC